MTKNCINNLSNSGLSQIIFQMGRCGEFFRSGEMFLDFFDELITDDDLIKVIENQVSNVNEWETKKFDSILDFRLFRFIIYSIVRLKKPKIIIETGVLHGMTSAFIIRALQKNGSGRLISIDLPSYPESGPANNDGYSAVLPKGKEPGWIVPDSWREGIWDLRLGDSVSVLNKIEDQFSVDIFLHDSEHTYQTMWQELNWAANHLSEHGVVICDNIESNTSFFDFARNILGECMIFPAPDSERAHSGRFGLFTKVS